MKKYDIAAFVWPAYTGDEPRTRMFWPEGCGEWQTVRAMKPKFEGHRWPRRPLWGYVNEADPSVMEMEIEAATSHGVNVFIYDWYWYDGRPFLEQCLDNGFLGAKNNHKMKFYLMWANHNAGCAWDKRISDFKVQIWNGAVDRNTFELIVHRTIEKYFKHPSYYKIDGRPVYMIYDIPNLVRGLGGIEETREALEYFREETVRAGFAGLELQVSYYGRQMDKHPELAEFLDESFDSATWYQFAHFTKMNRPYPEIFEDIKGNYERMVTERKMTFYPHVSVGWDSNPRFNVFHDDVCTDNTPENVEKAFEYAKAWVDSHPELKAPLITVNSWNEWTETSYLQPDDVYGYGYLEAIKKVFCK